MTIESASMFNMGARAMSAQLARLNAVASNIANAGATAGSAETAYRALRPVFETRYADGDPAAPLATVDVVEVQRSEAEPQRVRAPGHPQADAEGYIYLSNVNVPEELVDMLEASRQYQNIVESMNTMKALTLQTLRLGT